MCECVQLTMVVFMCQNDSASTSVGPPSAHQRNAIQMAFHWRADGGPLLDVYWKSISRSSEAVTDILLIRRMVLYVPRCCKGFPKDPFSIAQPFPSSPQSIENNLANVCSLIEYVFVYIVTATLQRTILVQTCLFLQKEFMDPHQ